MKHSYEFHVSFRGAHTVAVEFQHVTGGKVFGGLKTQLGKDPGKKAHLI